MSKTTQQQINQDTEGCGMEEQKDWKEQWEEIVKLNFGEEFAYGEGLLEKKVKAIGLAFIQSQVIPQVQEAERKEISREIAIISEPLPSAKDHKEYNRGVRRGVEIIRNRVVEILKSTPNKQ